MKKRVLIVGGGASGMTAAIQAARNGATVTILEHTGQVGKKLLSTGNGRCNLTNLYQAPECYRCGQEGFAWEALGQFSLEDVLGFFDGLGLLLKERQGYVYPNSGQASSVLDALVQGLKEQQVEVVLNCSIRSIDWKGMFLVSTDSGVFQGDALVLAAGSMAAKATGSDGSGYGLAKRFGHRIATPLPALVQLRCREKHYKQLAGVRADAGLTLMASTLPQKGGEEGWEIQAQAAGELQLTDYGISGIPTFQISRYASVALHKGQTVKAVIDFLPHIPMEALWGRMEEGGKGQRTWAQWLAGLINKKLGLVLIRLAGLAPDAPLFSSPRPSRERLLKQIKSYETYVTAANPFDKAQVCCGGVDVSQVCAKTMESKKQPGLYFAGEILDVDAICGGYNLHWAWVSGSLAGRHAAGKENL